MQDSGVWHIEKVLQGRLQRRLHLENAPHFDGSALELR
jgi:hypothetical protein